MRSTASPHSEPDRSTVHPPSRNGGVPRAPRPHGEAAGEEAHGPGAPAGGERGTSPTTELLARLRAHRPEKSRYEVRGEIARGGMGTIYSVWDGDLRRELAMKVCGGRDAGTPGPEEDESQRRLRAFFLEEAQITGQLGHPGIVPVHELGIDEDGRTFFTMPLVQGRNLEEIIGLVRRGREGWTLARALGVFLKVCEAMAFAHSKGVVHRDLKPANVMVGRYGETYVMDWGIARILEREGREAGAGTNAAGTLISTERSIAREGTPARMRTLNGHVAGTPAYMAPEQARGDLARLGPRSDVYAVGAMLYHLLSGHMPYVPTGERVTAYTVLGLLLHRAPEPVRERAPDAPDDLAAICEKAMSRDPAQRYGDTMEMAADIERFLDRRPVHAHRVGVLRALHLAYQRNRSLALTIATAALVLVGAGCVFVNQLHLKAEEERRAHLEAQRRGDEMASQALIQREQGLHPAVPTRVPAMRAWLASVEDLASREALYRDELERVDPGDGVVRENLEQMLAGIATLVGLREEVRARLEVAESLGERTLLDPGWDPAIHGVASLEVYGGLVLEPQLGLVPLRRNPDSGLWEFWHVSSGTRPIPDGGGYLLEEGSGMVFVLLPGGHFSMGSPEDELAHRDPEVLHTAHTGPFFLSRYEVTQGQYLRALADNPSLFRPGVDGFEGEDDHRYDLRHPVESVSWTNLVELGRRLDLRLPREREWEYACRAGTDTPYAEGLAASLKGMENVFDEAAEPMGFPPAAWNDGHAVHAPVGSFRPNAFGLHDMHGNVSEWCADDYVAYPGDEEPDRWMKIGRKVFRGGSWYLPPQYARCAFRQYDGHEGRNQARGGRLARDVRVTL